MNETRPAEFSGESRIHIGLAVKNLDQSVDFYQNLFGQSPVKMRPNYAKFSVAQPPINLAINAVGGDTAPIHPVSHFGIEVKSTDTVIETADRLRQAGVATEEQNHVSCCYAVQNKVWAADPDGNQWEVYVVLDDDAAQHHSSAEDCCTVDCCSDEESPADCADCN